MASQTKNARSSRFKVIKSVNYGQTTNMLNRKQIEALLKISPPKKVAKLTKQLVNLQFKNPK